MALPALEEQVIDLRETLRDFILFSQNQSKELWQAQIQTERKLDRLSDEMLEFKDEMKDFKDEMKAFKDEMLEFKDEMKAFKDEMKAFKDEMLEFKDEMKAFKDEMKAFKDEMLEFKDEMKDFKDEMKAFKDEMLEFKDEMKAFKDEMKAFKDEMLEFKDEMKDFKDEMKAFKDEMLEFKDEMKDFKDEMSTFERKTQQYIDEAKEDRKRMNKQWGDLANRLGTIAEDIVAPNIEGVVQRYFGCSELDSLMVRYRKRHPKDRKQRREFDVIALWENHVLLNETKSMPKLEYVQAFIEFLRSKAFFDFFPEYLGRTLIPVFSSLYLPEDIVQVLTRAGVYAMAMSDDSMDLLNFDQVSPS